MRRRLRRWVGEQRGGYRGGLFRRDVLRIVVSSEVDVGRFLLGTALGSPGPDARMGIRDV